MQMNSLSKYLKTSTVHVVRINYGGKKIIFNLADELKVTPLKINDEIKTQPSKYGFCLMLLGKLRTNFEDLKTTRRKVRGRLYKEAKETKMSTTGRPMSDDMAKAFVESHPKFIRAERACTRAKDQVDQMFAVVKAFEQRGSLIQTISSNIRNER